jgi:phospholipid/cholesterol/gamma-HCH transport system substrate-binding protein
MAKFTNEIKTGIVVIVTVVLLGIIVAMVGDYHLFDKGYTVDVIFDYINGVDENAPVRLAGVDVGQVKDVKLHYSDKTQVQLKLYLMPWAKIRTDSKIYSTSLGLMGEKYIEITPGSEGSPFVRPGSTLIGQNPIRIEDLLEAAENIADNIDKTLVDVRKLTKNINSAVGENKPKLDSIFDNLEVSSENLKEFTEDIKWHPWKLLRKGKERTTPEEEEKEKKEQVEIKKKQWQ